MLIYHFFFSRQPSINNFTATKHQIPIMKYDIFLESPGGVLKNPGAYVKNSFFNKRSHRIFFIFQ